VAEDGGGAGVLRLRGRADDVLGPAVDSRTKEITRDEAVARIAANYREWVDLFGKAR
jgi:hypothetical protein